MTPAINEAMLAIGSSLAASVVAKVTVIMALAIFAAWLARGSRAAVRHALLGAALGATLLLPVASVVVPPVHLGVAVVVENQHSALPPLVSSGYTPPALIADDPVIAGPRSPRISLSNLVLAGWVAGGTIFLLPLVIGLWQVRLLRRSGLPWRRGQSLADPIARDVGVHRSVEVLLHEEVPGPMTCGIVHPAIVLPRDAESWNEEDLNRAFVHELEHIRRGDSLSRSLARGACAMYWFHPLVWIAWRSLELEAERSCDDAVVRRSEATAYADQLVGLARRLSAAQRLPLLAMANRSDLSTRVSAVLDAGQRRGRAGTILVALACAAAAVLVISMSSLILVAAPQAQSPKDGLQFEVATVKAAGPQDTRMRRNGGPGTNDPGTLTFTKVPLELLLRDAYEVEADQISGPSWLSDERYDIVAKVPPGATIKDVDIMLRNLLLERFHMKVRLETQDVPGYELTIAKGGVKFKEADHPAPIPRRTDCRLGPDKDGFPQLAPGCQGQLMVGGAGTSISYIVGREVPLSKLMRDLLEVYLKVHLDRLVDKTGLTGRYYNYRLRFSGIGFSVVQSPEPSGPDLFNALQDQLGLRLEQKKVSVKIVVIEHVEKVPSAN